MFVRDHIEAAETIMRVSLKKRAADDDLSLRMSVIITYLCPENRSLLDGNKLLNNCQLIIPTLL